MLEEKVLETIKENNLIQKSDRVVIGVSGGPDSMCLLDILYCLKEKLNIELVVAHLNHGIREEADSETEYVKTYCKKNSIPCYVKKVDIPKLAKEEKLGTEEMGRKIRYEFFEEVSKETKSNKIATAHNSNDNAETVLMNLLRGSGVSGLKGIEIQRCNYKNEEEKNKDITEKEYEKLTYIRPLKNCTRQEIEEYCKEHNLQPKIDGSNFENIYTRNKIRNELIPYLKREFNPNIIDTLNRLSELAKEDDEYFSKIVVNSYETLKIGENEKEIILDLKGFNNLPKVIKSRLLLYTINKLIGTTNGISKVHIEDLIKLCENNIGNKYLTPNKNIKVFVKKGKIFFGSK